MKKFKFALKKFLFYILFSIPACSFPFLHFGMVMGFPSVIIMSIFVAIYDYFTVKDLDSLPKVFTATALKLWIVEVILVVINYFFVINGTMLIEYTGFKQFANFLIHIY